jgi:hypothetical protein
MEKGLVKGHKTHKLKLEILWSSSCMIFGESAKNNNKKSFLFPLCSSLATITSEVEF